MNILQNTTWLRSTGVKFIASIVIIGFAVYFNSLFNGFVLDDTAQLVNNPQVHTLENIPAIFTGTAQQGTMTLFSAFYRPVFLSAYAIMYAFFGASAFHFHLVQLLLFIANAVLVYLFFSLFFRKHISFVLSLIFLLHPINNQNAVYIANLQDVLYFFFGMLAFLVATSMRFSKVSSLVLSTFCLLLAMFSKESAVLFLIMIPLYRYLFKKKDTLLYSVLSAGILGTYLFCNFVIARNGITKDMFVPIAREPLFVRLLSVPKIITHYLQTFLFPKDLVSVQIWIVSKMTLRDFYLPMFLVILFMAGCIAGGIWIRKHKKSSFKMYMFFLLWLTIGMSLYLQILPLDATVADRWFYFPIVGLLGILGTVASGIHLNNTSHKTIALVCCALLLIGYAARDITRNADWKDDLTLYSHDSQLQTNYQLENGYGYALIKDQRYDEALQHLETSVNLAPYAFINWNNLGTVYHYYAVQTKEKEYLKKTEQAYLMSIKNEKRYFRPVENLAFFYYFNSDADKTYRFVNTWVKAFPSDKLWLVKALVEENKLGKHDAALQSAKTAYSINPSSEMYRLYGFLQNSEKVDILEADLFQSAGQQ